MDEAEIWLAGTTVKVCQLANGHLSRVGFVNGSLYAILTLEPLVSLDDLPCTDADPG